MTRKLTGSRYAWMLLGALAVLAGCGHLSGGGATPTTTPSSTPTASPSPGQCGTQSANPNVVFVAMTGGANAIVDGTYGRIGGYGTPDPDGFAPTEASVINQTSSGSAITPANTIQFYNAEPTGASVVHSAYGFSGNGFPSKGYKFPSPIPSPTASAIAGGGWFTGRIAAAQTYGSPCFSQEFTLKPGVYYFGDYDYYNLTLFRDVLVVVSSASSKRPRFGRAKPVHRPLVLRTGNAMR